MSKISVFVKLTSKPGKRADMVAVLDGIRPLIDAEDGTELYSVHLDQADDDVLWMLEVYRDQDAFDAHGSGEALATLFGDLGGLVGAPPELHMATPVSSKGLEV
jgi:quinol monooxygenase YgiN